MMAFGPDGQLYLSRFSGSSFAGLTILDPATLKPLDRMPSTSTLGFAFDRDGGHLWLADGSPSPDVLRRMELANGIESDTDDRPENGVTPVTMPFAFYPYDFACDIVVTP
jgi:hypothetical protein